MNISSGGMRQVNASGEYINALPWKYQMKIEIICFIGIFCLSSILVSNHFFYFINAHNSDRDYNLPNAFAVSQLLINNCQKYVSQ